MSAREERDHLADCEGFATSARVPVLRRFRDCEGDGHYRCKECVRLIARDPSEETRGFTWDQK